MREHQVLALGIVVLNRFVRIVKVVLSQSEVLGSCRVALVVIRQIRQELCIR